MKISAIDKFFMLASFPKKNDFETIAIMIRFKNRGSRFEP
jgi:hypothetical protein